MDDNHSLLLARDYKYFEAAKKAAMESTFKIKVGAIAVYKGRIIASAASQDKTHPMQDVWNRYRSLRQIGKCLPKVHAEIALLAKLKKMDVSMEHVKVYIYRLCKSREHGLSRPCEACYRALISAGLRVLYYTTDLGYCKEWIDYKGA